MTIIDPLTCAVLLRAANGGALDWNAVGIPGASKPIHGALLLAVAGAAEQPRAREWFP